MPAPEFMQQAISAAVKNVRHGGGPFGAVIVRDGEVIATGANHVTATNDPTAHAEVVAIREACTRLGTFDLAGCEIYTSCEPCPMCLGAIYWARLARIHYAASSADAANAGFDDRFIYDEIGRAHGDRRVPSEAVAHRDALAPFVEWHRKNDKIPY